MTFSSKKVQAEVCVKVRAPGSKSTVFSLTITYTHVWIRLLTHVWVHGPGGARQKKNV